MTVIWKYQIPIGDVVHIEMPAGAEPLYADIQGVMPCLWARVDPTQPKEIRCFRFAGTGHALDSGVGRHIGSWKMASGTLVFHLFEMERP
jgi:hypothetical protein